MYEFTDRNLHKLDPNQYWFECAMVTTCAPLFDDCGDNYDVEARLRKAKVLTAGCHTDTESCALVVNFKTKAAGLAFIKRLNRYLAEKGGHDAGRT